MEAVVTTVSNEQGKKSTSDCCTTETCDMFEFMSRYVGFKVLHPGGPKATLDMLALLNIDGRKKILDIACGKGITSIQIARKFGCKVVGIDIRGDSLEEATQNAKRKGVAHLVSFQEADATKMPFPENDFDVTLAQAMLILVKDSSLVMQEAMRVLKPGGKAGWLELCWRGRPSNDFLRAASEAMCGACIGNAGTDEQWKKKFAEACQRDVISTVYPMIFRGMVGMLLDEGLVNGVRIMAKYMTNANIRKRMQKLNTFFKTYPQFTGYGIFTFQK
jgi:ubiquinone/menaquinone biosynthesis C-methylase UbiE